MDCKSSYMFYGNCFWALESYLSTYSLTNKPVIWACCIFIWLSAQAFNSSYASEPLYVENWNMVQTFETSVDEPHWRELHAEIRYGNRILHRYRRLTSSSKASCGTATSTWSTITCYSTTTRVARLFISKQSSSPPPQHSPKPLRLRVLCVSPSDCGQQLSKKIAFA